MNASVSKLPRCAIYTRKSTEYNLELAFNSLDAQREACEAYIKSQAHEGWRLIPSRYDDGAFSGASLERPALQQLLADVRAGKIDIVLVYKVDRLTRSLADFAKLIELFDAHSVSFVSVTQSFNTSSSMGRLTLNVLLSFAQFERELIGERVRDKIAASKRKGLWVGGPVPLGYAAVDKKIVVVPAEAEAVRTIYARYVELGSIRALAEELDRQGIRSKPRRLSNGRTVGGGRFGVGALAHLLQNRFYIGEVVYRGEVHRGEHERILDSALFRAVQGKLAAQAVARRSRLRGSPALLTGHLFDERGNRMSPTHTNKGGARYRYYASQAVLQRKPHAIGSIGRVPAGEIEAVIVAALRNHLNANGAGEQPANDRELLERHLERVTLTSNRLELRLRPKSYLTFLSRGIAYQRKDDFAQAARDYEEAIKLKPDDGLLFLHRGYALAALGELDRAIADYDQATKLSPADPLAFFHRGSAYRDKGEYDRAIADYTEAMRLAPGNGAHFAYRGLAYTGQGDGERALADYAQALRLDPKLGLALYGRAVTHSNSGNYDLAIADYDAALRLEPEWAEPLFGRGMAKIKKGDAEGGKADIAKAMAIDADVAQDFAARGGRP